MQKLLQLKIIVFLWENTSRKSSDLSRAAWPFLSKGS